MALHRYILRFVGLQRDRQRDPIAGGLSTHLPGAGFGHHVARFPVFHGTQPTLAANEYRHRRTVERGTEGDLGDPEVKLECESLEAGLIRDERNRLIQQAINRLRASQCRAAFTLRMFYGCSYKEVADRLGISAKTVEKHIARGLRETHGFLTKRYAINGRDHG